MSRKIDELLNSSDKLLESYMKEDICPECSGEVDNNLNESANIIVPEPYNQFLQLFDYQPEEGEYQLGDEIKGYGCHILGFVEPKDEYKDVIDMDYFFLTDDPNYPVGLVCGGRYYNFEPSDYRLKYKDSNISEIVESDETQEIEKTEGNRVVYDWCTPTMERRPTTAEDVEDDICVVDYNNAEELYNDLLEITNWEDEDVAEEAGSDDIFEKVNCLLGFFTDPGDGSPNFLYCSVDGKECDEAIPYDCLDDLDLANCSEEDVKSAVKSEFVEYDDWDDEEDDYEDGEEYDESLRDAIDESYTQSQVKEVIRLCNQIGIKTLTDLKTFNEENPGDLLTALTNYKNSLGKNFRLPKKERGLSNESLNEAAKAQANSKWANIIKELDNAGIEYNLDDDPDQVFEDECLELIKIDGADAFGLFKDDNYYSICIGEDLVEAPKLSAKELVNQYIAMYIDESLNEKSQEENNEFEAEKKKFENYLNKFESYRTLNVDSKTIKVTKDSEESTLYILTLKKSIKGNELFNYVDYNIDTWEDSYGDFHVGINYNDEQVRDDWYEEICKKLDDIQRADKEFVWCDSKEEIESNTIEVDNYRSEPATYQYPGSQEVDLTGSLDLWMDIYFYTTAYLYPSNDDEKKQNESLNEDNNVYAYDNDNNSKTEIEIPEIKDGAIIVHTQEEWEDWD